jgi:hypothetical protein
MAHPSTADEQAILRTIASAYEALAFDPGEEPDWSLFTSAFDTRAVLGLRVFPHDRDIRVLDLADYAQAQLSNGLKEQGYSEEQGQGTIEVFGDVAVVRQQFTMVFMEGRVPAIDVFSLVRIDGIWRIISVISDLHTPA